jgi:hypothetical protein
MKNLVRHGAISNLLATMIIASGPLVAVANPKDEPSLPTGSVPDAIYFEDDFSDNSAGWTLDTEWQIGPATASPSPGSCGNGDPGDDHSPTADNGVAGVVIGGNASTAVHPYYYLTSPVVDLSAAAGSAWLSFYRWLNSDYSPFMQNSVEVWDGATWQTVWASGGAPGIQDSEWTLQTYDVTAFANAAFRVRLGHTVGSSGSFTCSSWNVDDLTIADLPVPVELMSFRVD